MLPPVLGGFRYVVLVDLCLSASAMDVFSAPSSFRPGDVPPFYKSLVLAWREPGSAFSAHRSSLVFGAADPLLLRTRLFNDDLVLLSFSTF